MMAQRIQRRRTKGWQMPDGAVYVGRPTALGNPFNGPHAVDLYRQWITGNMSWAEFERLASVIRFSAHRDLQEAKFLLTQIGGKDLACWCSLDQPCHADVLLELANVSTPPKPERE